MASTFLEWTQGYRTGNKLVWNWLTFGLGGTLYTGVAMFVYYKDIVALSPMLIPMVSIPFMNKIGKNYQGIVKSMGVPHLLCTIPTLFYFSYRLNIFGNNKNTNNNNNNENKIFGICDYKNIITKESKKYLYWYCIYAGIIWTTSSLIDIYGIFLWFIKGDKIVVRSKKTLKLLKQMDLLNYNVNEYQWIYKNGKKVDDNIDDFGYTKQ
eukprot:160647_1